MEIVSQEIRPCGDLILVERIGDDDTTEGGIVIPESAQDEHFPRWLVLATGPGHVGPGGVQIAPECEPGNKVLLSPARGQMFAVPGRSKKTMLVDAGCILAVLG